MKHNRILFLLLPLFLLAFTVFLAACSSAQDEEAEAAFIAAVEAIPPEDGALYVHFSSIDELIAGTHANRILRCTVTERGDCTVYDPFGKHSADDLGTSAEAKSWIATPYTLSIGEQYLGDVGADTLTFYAQYGIIGEHTYRKSLYPVLEVGKEYIFFLRVYTINGKEAAYLALTPDSVVELDGDTVRVKEGSHFADYTSAAELTSALTALITEKNYSTAVDVITTE